MPPPPISSAWELREGDRIPERLSRVALQLEGMENNPVFRLLILQSHNLRWCTFGTPFSFITPNSLLQLGWWLLLVTSTGSNSLSLFYICLISFPYARTLLRKFSRRHPHSRTFLGIADGIIAELHLSGVSAETFSLALWGIYATRDARSRQIAHFLIFLVLGLSAGGYGFLLGRNLAPSFLGIALFATAGIQLGMLNSPFEGLGDAYSYLRELFPKEMGSTRSQTASPRGCLIGSIALALVALFIVCLVSDPEWAHTIVFLLASAAVVFVISYFLGNQWRREDIIDRRTEAETLLNTLTAGLCQILHKITKDYTENPYPARIVQVGRPAEQANLNPRPAISANGTEG